MRETQKNIASTTPFEIECHCGNIIDAMPPEGRDDSNRFALIRNSDFARFISFESEAIHSKSNVKRLAAISNAADLVTSVYECPSCLSLIFIPPDSTNSEKITRKIYQPVG